VGENLDTGAGRHVRLAQARLYFVCDRAPAAGPFADVLRAALAGGVDVFQLRDKDAGDAELLAAAAVARELCDEAGALFIVNDRPDLARAAQADGVHVGRDDMPVRDAREIVGSDLIVGLSTHAAAEIDASEGADYIGVGPIHATPTKAGRPGVGLDLVRIAVRRATVPFFAIGGIDLETAPAVVTAGATRIAVVRAIAESENPERAARALRAIVDSETRSHVGAA
jgi:thiamine-phosphate pyrophosphorylase